MSNSSSLSSCPDGPRGLGCYPRCLTASAVPAWTWPRPGFWRCAPCPPPSPARASPLVLIAATEYSASCPLLPLGRGGGLIAGKILAVLVVLFLQVLVVGAVAGLLGWQPPRLEAWLPGAGLLVLGAAAFTALGLLVAGTVRPEATLAITNLLWILLGALGGIVVPAERLPSLLQGDRSIPSLRGGPGPSTSGRLPVGRCSLPPRRSSPPPVDRTGRRRGHPLVQMELTRPGTNHQRRTEK